MKKLLIALLIFAGCDYSRKTTENIPLFLEKKTSVLFKCGLPLTKHETNFGECYYYIYHHSTAIRFQDDTEFPFFVIFQNDTVRGIIKP